jgi:16S rRNA (guanine966-N2)-methyltransferase
MRIVAGEFRGRRLHSPKSRTIRPTGDRVREAIFSIIAQRIPGANVLDLFAGTGALGLEALSRGAARVLFVDDSTEAVRLIQENVRLCGVQDRARVVHGPVDRVLRRFLKENRGGFTVVFLDPPYGKGYVEKTLELLTPITDLDALVVAEHDTREDLPAKISDWLLTQGRRYGDTAISFFVRDNP